jgi:hypothetical protein
MEPFIWGEAEVTYPDFKGTAQLDQKMTGTSGFTLAGIDQEKWLVIGLDIGGGEGEHSLRVVAIDRDIIPDGQSNVLDYLVEKHGHIPVTEILLHDVDPYEALKSVTHVFELRLRSRNAVGRNIMVTAYGDIPAQTEQTGSLSHSGD